MLVLVQLKWWVTRGVLLGRCYAEVITVNIIGVGFGLLLAVETVEEANREVFAKGLSRKNR